MTCTILPVTALSGFYMDHVGTARLKGRGQWCLHQGTIEKLVSFLFFFLSGWRGEEDPSHGDLVRSCCSDAGRRGVPPRGDLLVVLARLGR